jgi:Holliday junction resolvase RusA-like endonuclease
MAKPEFPHWMPAELFKERPDSATVREQLLGAYQLATGTPLGQPPSPAEIESVCRWMNANFEIFVPLLVKGHRMLKRIYSASLSEKIMSLAQHHCPLCTVHEGGLPTHVMSIRIPPISKQAAARIKGRRAAFERAIAHRFAKTETPFPEHISICLLIVFVVRASGAQKDLDNMAKALLDAIKNVLFGDDRRIDHLNIIRIKSPGEEFVYLNIRETRLNDHDDVLFPQMSHSWGGSEALNLEDFMEES